MAVVGLGTKLEVSIASVYTTIAGVNDLRMPKSSTMIPTGHLTSGRAETYAAGPTDAQCTGTLQYDRSDSVHAVLEDAEINGDTLSFRITMVDGSTESFSGLIETFDKGAERAGLQNVNFTIQRSGASTIG